MCDRKDLKSKCAQDSHSWVVLYLSSFITVIIVEQRLSYEVSNSKDFPVFSIAVGFTDTLVKGAVISQAF